MNKLESMEDYLEKILMLEKTTGSVRAIDIANDMNYSRASVSIAIKKLRVKEYIIIVEPGSVIKLTDKGRKIAENIFERHDVLSKVLMSLGVTKEIALQDACKIEHDISDESFIKIKDHIAKKHNN